MHIKGYAVRQAKLSLEKFEYKAEELGAWDVEIAITHCGICHSDIHLIDDDWHISQYPLLPGHEIIGQIVAAGARVNHLHIGQRVGVGWQRSACLKCEQCLAGDDNLCEESHATCVGHYGGFAESIRTDSRFVFAIPDRLSSENAAPLLCAGITVYSPLKHFHVRPSMKAGVIGIGGLGHLALQFTRAFGCEVTAFSTSPDKEAEAKSFGAHHFINSRDPSQMQTAAGKLDFILSTVFADLDWTGYMNLLKPRGNLCFVGAAASPVQIPVFSLITGQKSISGSPIGSRSAMNEMLEFAARHNIKAKTEVLPMTEVNRAIQKVRDNKARYRMVLVN
ncbi:MAG: NAD(P)-dependent alcohol dehydrogenase [candidate division Zixibacteria bacterium]|nr:NAD(P)-dependent alcohol dehydrogenase [candidate division Zixibacteria bacterium]